MLHVLPLVLLNYVYSFLLPLMSSTTTTSSFSSSFSVVITLWQRLFLHFSEDGHVRSYNSHCDRYFNISWRLSKLNYRFWVILYGVSMWWRLWRSSCRSASYEENTQQPIAIFITMGPGKELMSDLVEKTEVDVIYLYLFEYVSNKNYM